MVDVDVAVGRLSVSEMTAAERQARKRERRRGRKARKRAREAQARVMAMQAPLTSADRVMMWASLPAELRHYLWMTSK